MNLEDDDEDEIFDDLAKFVEGQDVELVKDHSNQFEDDEKVIKRNKQKMKEMGVKPVDPWDTKPQRDGYEEKKQP